MVAALKTSSSFAQLTTGGPVNGRRQAAFHGHGVGKDDAKDDLFLYFRATDLRTPQPETQPFRRSHVFTAWVSTTYPSRIKAIRGQ
jgi:hypothetical protein